MFAPVLLSFFTSTSDGFVIAFMCLAGAAAGTFLFFKGFRMLRYKRLILDTPLSRIHSASIGLVEITGTPTGPKTIVAPVTGAPCYYYRVQAWQWEQSGKNHQWKRVLDESLYVPFFLEDSTGRILIDPQGAEMDVHRSFSDEIGASFFHSRELLPPNVRDFFAKRGLVPYDKIKLEERILQPQFPLFVFGTLGENPSRGFWEPRPHHTGGASSFNIHLGASPSIGMTVLTTKIGSQSGPMVIPDNAAAILQRAGINLPPGMATKSAATAAVLDDVVPANPNAPSFDLSPSAAVSKGQRGDPFTISWHSQREVVQSLAWKSTLCIWGGPVLAIVSLYFLLLFWNLISL